MSQASRSCQSAVGQTETTLGDRLAVVEPDLDADAARLLDEREQVVVDREALRLRLGQRAEPCEPGALRSRPLAVPM